MTIYQIDISIGYSTFTFGLFMHRNQAEATLERLFQDFLDRDEDLFNYLSRIDFDIEEGEGEDLTYELSLIIWSDILEAPQQRTTIKKLNAILPVTAPSPKLDQQRLAHPATVINRISKFDDILLA